MLFLIGYTVSVFLMMRGSKRYGINKNDILYASLYAAIGIGVGAKAAYFLSKIPRIIMNPDAFIELFRLDYKVALTYLFGGLTFYGGLLGAILGVFIYCRQYRIDRMQILNYAAIYFPFIHMFGRIGCFLAGCCYGKEYHGPLAVHFPYNPNTPELSEVSRIPVQLMEAGINLLIFLILLLLSSRLIKKQVKKNLQIYLLLYSFARFFLEYLRGDLDRGQYRLFSTSQWISLAVFFGTLLCEWIRYMRKKRMPDH